MGSHIHQCPKCWHTFVCDYPSCEGKINVQDVRCVLGWGTGLGKMSAMQLGYVDSYYEYRGNGGWHKRALETRIHRPVSIAHREQDGPLWDVKPTG